MAALVYPVVFTPYRGSYSVYVPDMEINTQGNDLAEAISMARDAIGLTGITMQDEGMEISPPTDVSSIKKGDNEILAVVDIDFDEYRRKHDNRTERRNVSIPRWLNELAKEEDINVSEILVEALKERLNVS